METKFRLEIRLQYQFKQTLLNYAIVEGNISSHKNRNSGNQEFLIHPFFSLAKGTIKKKSKFAKRKLILRLNNNSNFKERFFLDKGVNRLQYSKRRLT